MKKEKAKRKIKNLFKKQVQKDPRVKNAYLLVHSKKADIHINIAEGSTGDIPANPQQPYYIASVGKLFTSVLISILFEKEELSFDDKIIQILDKELLQNLHLYKGKDYTKKIKVKHLLNHTSGLKDTFYPLLEKLLKEPEFEISPREVIEWSKNNLEPHCPPGEAFNYSDANYHLLGLIIEEITDLPFHEALVEYIFTPLKMNHSSMLYSKPLEEYQYPIADFYIRDIRLNDYQGYGQIDYAGGGIVATSEDLLKFMKALVKGEIIAKDTFAKMQDWAKYFIGIDYGYGLMKLKTIPLLMPKKYNAWGNVGAIGSFMFYHPEMDTYLIGNFNHFAYEKKGVRFMLKAINKLSKTI